MPRSIFIVVVLAVAASCGPRDTEPPKVVAVTPTEGAAEVQLDQAFKVVFSEPLGSASFASDRVVFEVNGEQLDVSVERGADDRTMLIRPTEQPETLPATATVRLLDTISDRAGNALAPYSWSFELADWIPLEASINRNPDEDVNELSLVWMSGPVLAWTEKEAGSGVAHAARWDEESSTWQPLGDVLGGARGYHALEPYLVAYHDTLHAVWHGIVRDNHRIYHAWWDGASWQHTTEPLNHDLQRNAFALVAASDQNLWAAWYELGSSNNPYGVFSVFGGSSWTPGSPDWNTSTTTQRPSSLVAHEGEAWLAYTPENGNARVLHYGGASWSPLGAAFDADGNAGTPSLRPRLAYIPDGRLIALWLEGNQVYAALWDGANWGRLGGTVNRLDTANAYGLTVSQNGWFAAVAEWDRMARLVVRYWDADRSHWADLGGPTTVLEGAGDYVDGVQIVSDDAGWPVVAWIEKVGGVKQLHAARYNHVQ